MNPIIWNIALSALIILLICTCYEVRLITQWRWYVLRQRRRRGGVLEASVNANTVVNGAADGLEFVQATNAGAHRLTPELIARLPVFAWGSDKQADQDLEAAVVKDHGEEDCAICQEQAALGDAMCVLPCRHTYHQECIAAWLVRRSTCPKCRFDLVLDLVPGQEQQLQRALPAPVLLQPQQGGMPARIILEEGGSSSSGVVSGEPGQASSSSPALHLPPAAGESVAPSLERHAQQAQQQQQQGQVDTALAAEASLEAPVATAVVTTATSTAAGPERSEEQEGGGLGRSVPHEQQQQQEGQQGFEEGQAREQEQQGEEGRQHAPPASAEGDSMTATVGSGNAIAAVDAADVLSPSNFDSPAMSEVYHPIQVAVASSENKEEKRPQSCGCNTHDFGSSRGGG